MVCEPGEGRTGYVGDFVERTGCAGDSARVIVSGSTGLWYGRHFRMWATREDSRRRTTVRSDGVFWGTSLTYSSLPGVSSTTKKSGTHLYRAQRSRDSRNNSSISSAYQYVFLNDSWEIQHFVGTHIFNLRGILRSRQLRALGELSPTAVELRECSSSSRRRSWVSIKSSHSKSSSSSINSAVQ